MRLLFNRINHFKIEKVMDNFLRHNSTEILSKEQFSHDVINSKGISVVKFHATWCQPCKQLTPKVVNLIDGYNGKVTLFDVDVDKNDELAEEYQIMSVPSILVISDGKTIKSFIGNNTMEHLTKTLDNLVDKH